MLAQAVRSYRISVWLFLRLLGVCLLSAFLAMNHQIPGLLGSGGILPVPHTLESFALKHGAWAPLLKPTIFWLAAGDQWLFLASAFGVLLALCVIVGVATGPALLLSYLLYLSILNVGGDFFDFQWDYLIVQTALLAAFLRPWGTVEPKPTSSSFEYSALVFILLRALFCQLMFCSGAVKLLSGCPLWRNLTALAYYYQNQLSPTIFAWYAHQLPQWFHIFCTGLVLTVELVAPFCLLLPAKLRNVAGLSLCLLQVGFMLTGNHGFINLLTIALTLTLVDDQCWQRLIPQVVYTRWLGLPGMQVWAQRAWLESLTQKLAPLCTALIITALLVQTYITLSRYCVHNDTIDWVSRRFSAYGLGGRYGLYAWVFPRRTQIVIEGSHDGMVWLAYGLPYEISDPERAPPMATIYQPRLDWLMQFAAHSSRRPYWFDSFLKLLSSDSPAVLKLVANNPFASSPPTFLRARLYDYEFTSDSQKAATHCWWTRKPLRWYTQTYSASEL